MKKRFFILVISTLISACKEQVEPQSEVIRAVKTMTISEAEKENSRQISGSVNSADESALSFPCRWPGRQR